MALLSGDPRIIRRVDSQARVYLPSIALGAVLRRVQVSAARRPTPYVERVDAFARDAAVVVCNHVSAQRYGRLKALLRSCGPPIPENDLWIAAIAVQHNLTLITRDSYFQVVAGLRTESGIDS